jgi:uncharacterized lipoprotein YmbA
VAVRRSPPEPAVARRSLIVLGGGAALAACRSPDPVLYTILPSPGAQRRGGPRTVAVREVSLARYLDRVQIVRSANEYRLDVSGNDWWGEALDAMLTRVLVENLAQRLPASSVVASGGAITVTPDAVVEVNVQRLGLVAPTQLALTAQVSVGHRDNRRRDVTRTESLNVPVTGTDTAAFVAAASSAVGQLADAIASALAG